MLGSNSLNLPSPKTIIFNYISNNIELQYNLYNPVVPHSGTSNKIIQNFNNARRGFSCFTILQSTKRQLKNIILLLGTQYQTTVRLNTAFTHVYRDQYLNYCISYVILGRLKHIPINPAFLVIWHWESRYMDGLCRCVPVTWLGCLRLWCLETDISADKSWWRTWTCEENTPTLGSCSCGSLWTVPAGSIHLHSLDPLFWNANTNVTTIT